MICKELKEVGTIHGCAAFGLSQDKIARERLNGQKDIRRSASFIFIIHASALSGTRREWSSRVRDQLLARLVETDNRTLKVVRQMVDIEDIFHRVHEGSIVLWRNAKSFHCPRLDVIFFSRRCTVLRLIVSTTFSSTSLSVSMLSVQRVAPCGGVLHAT